MPRRKRVVHFAALAGLPADERVPPAEVAADPRAAAAWAEALDAVVALGLYRRADRPAVARYAVLRAAFLDAVDAVRASGSTMKTRTGYEAPTPAAVQLLKLAGTLGTLENALGFTPAGRARMKHVPPSEDDREEAALRAFIGDG